MCRPVLAVEVLGPEILVVGEVADYQAVYTPTDTTWPLTVTWSNGAVGFTASYSWTTAGTYTVTATAVSHCGMASGHQVVQVQTLWYRVYLPIVQRSG